MMREAVLTNGLLPQANKTRLKLAALLMLAALTIASVLGSRVIGLAFVIGVIVFLFHARRYILKGVLNYKYLLFLLVPFIGTANSVLSFNEYPDIWQVLRLQIWTLMIPMLAYTAYRSAIQSSDNFLQSVKYFVKLYLIGVSLLLLLEYFLGVPLSPAYIRPSYQDLLVEDGRIYVFGLQLVAPFLPILMFEKNWLAVAACLLILLLTGGKLAIIPIFTLFLFIAGLKKSRVPNKRIVMVFPIIGIVAVMFFIGERYLKLMDVGDRRRYVQTFDVIQKLSRDRVTLLFGSGLGTKYSEGYFVSFNPGNDDITPLLINSQYDVETGYGHLALRLGLIGMLLFFLLIGFQMGTYKSYFMTYWTLSFFGFAPAGPLAAFEFAVFGFCAAYYQRYRSSFGVSRIAPGLLEGK